MAGDTIFCYVSVYTLPQAGGGAVGVSVVSDSQLPQPAALVPRSLFSLGVTVAFLDTVDSGHRDMFRAVWLG